MLQYVAVCCGVFIRLKPPNASPITSWANEEYGVATISRLLKIVGLFCRISSLLWVSFAKETYNFTEPTKCSHPIAYNIHIYMHMEEKKFS